MRTNPKIVENTACVNGYCFEIEAPERVALVKYYYSSLDGIVIEELVETFSRLEILEQENAEFFARVRKQYTKGKPFVIRRNAMGFFFEQEYDPYDCDLRAAKMREDYLKRQMELAQFDAFD